MLRLATYDAEVRAREIKWGVDRLPLLVEPELRDRFWAQMEVLNKAIAKGSGIEVEEAVAATVRGRTGAGAQGHRAWG